MSKLSCQIVNISVRRSLETCEEFITTRDTSHDENIGYNYITLKFNFLPVNLILFDFLFNFLYAKTA